MAPTVPTQRPRTPSTMGRWAARHHPVVWWIIVIKVTFTLSFSLLIPFFRGPDEILHISLLRWYGENIGYTDPTVRLPVDGALLALGVDPPRPPGDAARPPLQEADALPRAERPTLGDLSDAPPGPATNQLSQHPALFYVVTNAATGVVAGLIPEHLWTWDRQSLAYRWQSVALSALLPLVASSAALAAGLRRSAAAVAAAFVLLVPMHSFIGAVVNNDSWVVLAAGVSVAATLAYLRGGPDGPHRRRHAVVAACAIAVAVASKTTALPVLPWVMIAVAFPVWWAWRRSQPLRQPLGTLALAAAIGVVGSAWQLANLVRFGRLQPSSYSLEVRADVETSLGEFVATWPSRLSVSFWGQPGRRTGVTLPEAVTGVLSVVTIALMVIAVAAAWRRGRDRTTATMLALLCAGQLVLVGRTNWAGYFRGSGLEGFQGRYFFIVLVPMAVLVAMGVVATVSWVAPRARGVTEVRVAVGMAAVGWVVHATLAVRMIQRYWGDPTGPLSANLAAVRAWSPLPDLATQMVLWSPVVVAAAAVGTWGAGRVRRRHPRGGPPAPNQAAPNQAAPNQDGWGRTGDPNQPATAG